MTDAIWDDGWVWDGGVIWDGVTVAPPTYTGSYIWVLTINWNGTEINEADGRLVDVRFGDKRGRENYTSGDNLNRVAPGMAVCKLNNSDGRFDGYNEDSPLYGILSTDKLARLSVYVISTGVTYSVITGKVTRVYPFQDDGGSKWCYIDIAGGSQYAADCDINSITPLYNTTPNVAIEAVLNAIQYPYGSGIEASAAPIYFFSPTGNALDILDNLGNSGLGTLFAANDGKIKYYDLATTTQTVHSLGQATLLKKMPVEQPWMTKRNSIRVFANRYGTRPASVIWTLDAPTYVGPRQSWVTKITYEQAQPIQPVKHKDYDPSLYYAPVVGGFGSYPEKWSVVLSDIHDTYAYMTVFNADPDIGSYIKWINVRGTQIVQKKVPCDSGSTGAKGNGVISVVYEETYSDAGSTLIAAGATVTKSITFAECNVVQPVGGVDYYSGAGHRPIVSGGVITYGAYFYVYLTNITSTGADRNITNLDPDSPQHFGNLRIRGEEISQAAVSIGLKQLTIDNQFIQDPGRGAAYAALLLALLQGDAKNPVIQIESRPEAFAIDLYDKITLDASGVGIASQTFDVMAIDFQWLHETGQGFAHVFYLGKLPHSTAAITPQPYLPGGNPIPPETPEPVDPPPLPGTSACLSPTGGGLETGPIGFEGGVISNDKPYLWAPIGKTLRQSNHPYRSYLVIDGTWESLSSGVWTADATFDFEALQAKDAAGNVTATGVLSSAQVADGQRTYAFNNSVGADIDSLLMALAKSATSDTYAIVGDPIQTGTVLGINCAGDVITGLTPGKLYAIQSHTGGFYAGGPLNPQAFSIKMFTNAWFGHATLPDPPHFELIEKPGVIPEWAYPLWNYRNRMYTPGPDSGQMLVGPDDTDCSDNSGSIGWALYEATAGATADKRIRIRSVGLYNYCPGR